MSPVESVMSERQEASAREHTAGAFEYVTQQLAMTQEYFPAAAAAEVLRGMLSDLDESFGAHVSGDEAAQLVAVFHNRVLEDAIGALPKGIREQCRASIRAGDGESVKQMFDKHGVDVRPIAQRISTEFRNELSARTN